MHSLFEKLRINLLNIYHIRPLAATVWDQHFQKVSET